MQRVLYSDAIRFLTALTADGKCPMCGTNSWNVATKGTNPAECELSPSNLSQSGSPEGDVQLDCKVCGYVRLHRSYLIISWAAENPDAGEVIS